MEGGCFDDLTPLARLPQLREVVLVRERPLDLSPLTEAPSLHEIKVERCTILNTELAALNAGLIPWEQDFLLLQPRPLAPLRFIRYDPQHEELKALYPIWNALPDPRTQFYGEDVAYADAEGRWFGQETIRRLTALLGPGWQGEFCDVNTGGGNLCFARYRDLLRMREILQTLRELMAAVRLPTSFMLNFEPHGDMSVDLAQIEDRRQLPAEGPWLVQEFDPVREKENRESFNEERRKRFELMEREHRLRLLEQQGAKIDPAEFSPGGEPPLENVAAGPTEPAEDESDDDDGGGVATPPPPPDGESELAAKLRFLVTLHEDVLWSTGGKMGENAAYAYGEKPEDWHALPEPPEKRPRPR